jgi:hypothetical protein
MNKNNSGKSASIDPRVIATVTVMNRGIERIETFQTASDLTVGILEATAGGLGYGAIKAITGVYKVAGLASAPSIDQLKQQGTVTESEAQGLKVMATLGLGMLGMDALL